MRQFAFLILAGLMAACSNVEDARSPSTPPVIDTASYQPTEWLRKTLPEQAAALRAGDVSAEDLIQAYLNRIDAIDRSGPTLQSVLTINPDALADARAADAKRAANEPLGALHGVPILLKDNIESKDAMATTAGAIALKDNITRRDSPLVAGLRDAGAIILGKTNLSQWANFRSTGSLSGWSALGGQVKNPHMLDRNPCGSSSGSGAAMAASLAAGAVGTETNGSIICPSNVNGVVGFKPTVGLVPQDYIVPISSTQDTAGPMTKTVTGAAMMLTAMAVADEKTDYAATLDDGALAGKKIGVLRYTLNDSADINSTFETALKALEAGGATLVDIDSHDPDVPDLGRKSFDLLKYEFKETLNAYLADTPPEVTVRDLASLISFNSASEREMALFDQDLMDQSEAFDDLTPEEYVSVRADVLRANQDNGIDKLLADYDVDVLVSPSGVVAPRVDAINGDVWPRWSGGGSMAARAGYPHATVPMGTVHGLPIGISFIGAKNDDAGILSVAYAYEQATQERVDPGYLASAHDRPEIAAAMARPD